MRPIDADSITKDLEKFKEYYESIRDDDAADGVSGCIGYVEDSPTIQLPHWESVKERLPDPIPPTDQNYMPYLIRDSLGYFHVADYTYDKYFQTCYSFHVDGEEVTDVEYWMRIEPPKKNN